jgi:hypothetical protein
MDRKAAYPMMLAPGGSASTPLRFPGADGPWPALDDHLVKPEASRDEVVRGRRIQAMAANPPHADQQSRLDYLLNAHARPGYVVSTELLTRVGLKSDFASDVCIRRDGIDPDTGKRHLEELVFEVVSEQSLKDITEKAEDMIGRGVRRVFAIFVKTGEVKEWQGAWLLSGQEIADPLLAGPLPVRSILDAAAADDAVVRALDQKGNRAIQQIRQEGRLAQARDMLLRIVSRRGFSLPLDLRARILASQDLAELEGWTDRAVTATDLADVFAT